jgi:hypothetical protein
MYKLTIWFEGFDVIHRTETYEEAQEWIRHAEAQDCEKWQLEENGIITEGYNRPPEDYEGQPTEYEEWQDYMGGDDWDHGQYDDGGY